MKVPALHRTLTQFMPARTAENQDVLAASFHGRAMRGRDVSLPAGYSGSSDAPVECDQVISSPRDRCDNRGAGRRDVRTRRTLRPHDVLESRREARPAKLECEPNQSCVVQVLPSSCDLFPRCVDYLDMAETVCPQQNADCADWPSLCRSTAHSPTVLQATHSQRSRCTLAGCF